MLSFPAGSGPAKFKNAILQRYLNDTIKYSNCSCHYPELQPRAAKLRQNSSSSGGETSSDDSTLADLLSPVKADCDYSDSVTWTGEHQFLSLSPPPSSPPPPPR